VDELVRTELEPRLERSMREGAAGRLARPPGRLRLLAGTGEGDSVVVFDPEDHEREIARFAFPRQGEQHRLCLADNVRPRELAVGGEARRHRAPGGDHRAPASEVSNQLQVQRLLR